jgi:hypothetical protein
MVEWIGRGHHRRTYRVVIDGRVALGCGHRRVAEEGLDGAQVAAAAVRPVAKGRQQLGAALD